MNKSAPIVPVILCGGVGSRLWPVSRDLYPKPFIRLDDGSSLLQKAFLRASLLTDVGNVITVTNRDLLFLVEDEYKALNQPIDKSVRQAFILEPFGRNTAAAITSACLLAKELYDDRAILVVLPADHLINDVKGFTEAITQAKPLAQGGKLVAFGIRPTRVETGYGYIEANGTELLRFVEKPSPQKARSYLEAGNFLWNSGIYCFQASSLLEEIGALSPKVLETSKASMESARYLSNEGVSQIEISPECFQSVPDISIDYAVLEKTRKAAVIRCDFDWSDLGCWRSLGDLTPADNNGNRIQGNAILADSKGCTVKSDRRMIGVVGVENLVVIDTPDALLVADKGHAANVKSIYAQLKEQGHETYRHHYKAQRPWGHYEVLSEGEAFKVKRIEVAVGASLSLQMHHHRSEHWILLKGQAQVVNGDKELVLNVNESTYIPAGNRHRLTNSGTETLVIIEVQTGAYLGEDDIVRFADNYGRAGDE